MNDGDGRSAKARDARALDYEALASFLQAMSYPLRLELLEVLRFPHTLSEIRLSPHRSHPGENPDRPAARQTVQVHLDRLAEADLVRAETVEVRGRPVPRYVVNSLKLYAAVEELRRISVRVAGRGPVEDVTGTSGAEPEPGAYDGRRLVLTHGVYEGRSYALPRAADGGGRWVVGRAPACDVRLDYDPFVSLEHAAIEESSGRIVLRDLGSKNGTRVNWSTIPPREARALRPGDVVGVGRSMLCFAE